MIASSCCFAGGLLAENLAFVASSRFSKLPALAPSSAASLPTSHNLVCIAAAAAADRQTPPRQAFIPLIARDEHGKLTLKMPADDGPSEKPKMQQNSSPPYMRSAAPKRAISSKQVPTGPPKFSKASRRFYNETFREPQRLSKVLAAAGVASRRTSEEFIFEGRVTVNGNVCKIPQTSVNPLKDVIYVDGRSLPKKMAPKLYFALNKPKGYICSSSESETKSVLSCFDEYMKIWGQRNPGMSKPRLFTVGRLDVATTGLLFVTNDGDFAFNVSHPSSGLLKEYIATVGNKVSKRHLQAIADGTIVQGSQCIPEAVELLDGEPGDTKTRLRIVVSDGRNHEVRHLVENAGLEVHALKRVRIGGYRLPRTLGLGKHLLLSESDLKKIQPTILQKKTDAAK